MSPKTARLATSLAILGLAALPALAETRIDKTLKLSPGGEFRLDTDMGKVTLVGSNEADAHVVITSRRKDLDELLTFRFDESPGLVSITARKKHKFDWFSSSGGYIQYEVRVPSQTRVWIDTSGGGITVSGIHGEVRIDTSGRRHQRHRRRGQRRCGHLRRLASPCAKSRATSGPTRPAAASRRPESRDRSRPRARAARSSWNACRATSMPIPREAGFGSSKPAGGSVADTSGGGIEASFVRGNSRGGSLSTSGGGIEVSIDPGADLAIEASGNAVKTDLPLAVRGEISRGNLSGTLGKGGNTLRLHTSGGSVRIQSL